MKSITLFALAGLVATSVEAQCRPPANSHEARLLAFYEAPLVFSMAGAPTQLAAGELHDFSARTARDRGRCWRAG